MSSAPTVKLCPTCRTRVPPDRTRCRHCLSDVRRAPTMSEEEARVLEREPARPPLVTGRRLLGLAMLVLLALFGWRVYAAFFEPRELLPLPASNAIAVATGSTRWPMADGGIGATRATSAVPALGAEVAWEVTLGSTVETPPVADEHRLYLGLGDDRFVALSVDDGRELWSFVVGFPLWSAPTVAGDRLYLALRNGDVIALDASDARELWRVRKQEAFFTSPAVVSGVVYVNGEGVLFGLDAEDGSELWREETGELRAGMKPALSREQLVVSAGDQVAIYDLRSGERTYSFPDPRIEDLLIDGEHVFSVSPSRVAALNSQVRPYWWEGVRGLWAHVWLWGIVPEPPRHRSLWLSRVPPSEEIPRLAAAAMYAPALDEERLVVANADGLVRAYDRQSGLLAWELRLEEVVGSPTFTGSGLLLPTASSLTLRNPEDGVEREHRLLAAEGPRHLVVTEHGTYVVDASGRVLVLR